MSSNSTQRGFAIAGALLLTTTIGTLTLANRGNARAASGASLPAVRASAQRADCATTANASSFAVGAARALPIVVAHLDEESVSAAENPGAPVLEGSAPETNPGPATDWERVPPADGGNSEAAARSAKFAPAAGAAADSGNRAANSGMKPAANPPVQPAAPAATVASAQHAPVPAAGNASAGPVTGSSETAVAGEQQADLGPPPALDLGTIQSGPDLSASSLADEIKKAETPARSAALRVTEQARVDLAAGKTDDALRGLGRAVSIDPGNPFEYFYLGRAYVARRNYAQALTFFRRAEIGFGARPDWLGETVGLEGVCHEELGRMTEAALAYRRALGSAQGNLRARVGYSRLSGYLPSTATADAPAAGAPANEALPPPERTAAGPAPVEAPPPPPPAPVTQPDAAKKIFGVHALHDQPDPDGQPD